ncbi:MAG: tRNA(Ile)-lysidine synthase [Proteobacteria bacterium SG_bin4]|nr:MAG: tRNA(Ile)-lysidine synthase [Proteobacteria bacterium SG_bin4]
MAHSRKSKSTSLLCHVQEALHTHIKPDDRLAIALSGGVDSVVLLHVLSKLSAEIPFSLTAVHVNHGISRNAPLWSQFCSDLCHSYGIPIDIANLNLKKEPGISLEALAREERYRIFSRTQADCVVLAHHLDDQAETLLLQLFRGAGIKGLSGMPWIRKQSDVAAPQLLRPFLEVTRDQIEAYARQHRLNWVYDESNDSTTYNRNFLRHEILPVLKKRYPGYGKTLLRTSRHLSEASQLLDELAEIDSANCLSGGKLAIDKLRLLSFSRAKNLLRHTLSQQNLPLPSAVKLEDILKQLLSSSTDNQIHIRFGDTAIRCFKGLVHIFPEEVALQAPRSSQFIWQGQLPLTLTHLSGTVCLTETGSQGIDPQKILNQSVSLRTRQGGEHFKPACNRPTRRLKNLLQEASIPPWQRHTMPLLFCNDQLIWVPGIGIECNFQVKSGETGILPIWNS